MSYLWKDFSKSFLLIQLKFNLKIIVYLQISILFSAFLGDVQKDMGDMAIKFASGHGAWNK